LLSATWVILAGLAWLGGLFGVALWGERYAAKFTRGWSVVYALSLAVYCTSWTFYGTVTQAAQSGWWLPPTFVGTIVLYALAVGVLERLVRVAREYNATSIADLIAARCGRSSALAALVTLVAVVGIVPYIALQLKAVAMSYALLTHSGDLTPPPWQDSALYVALVMALFAMAFGARRANAAEHNHGLVLAMAFEAILKLGAMLALATILPGLDLPPTTPREGGGQGFLGLVILGALAMFTLPHQFHVGVVECRTPRHLTTARWMFPLYMLLIALPILPLARAGDALLGARGVPSDLYVLALPLAQGHHGLALLAFLGGLSAATGMVILATLALSLMIGNHWLAPLLLRTGWARESRGDLRGVVLAQRRVGILVIVLLAWAYSRAVGASDALADIGAVSFSALATLAPAVLIAIYRPSLGARAVGAGIVSGVVVWLYALAVPTILGAVGAPPAWMSAGPFGISWLAPDQLLGLAGWGRLNRAVILGLILEVAVMLLFAQRPRRVRDSAPRSELIAADLIRVARRFLPAERVTALFAGADPLRPVDAARVASVEHELAAVIGASSARLLVDTARREVGAELDQVAAIVGEASADLRFNQRLLEAAMENMSQGICVVDADLNVVAWNRRYAQLFDYPDGLLRVGCPVADLMRFNVTRGLAGDGAADALVGKRLAFMRQGSAHVSERRFPDGTIVEIRGNPMPGGGFVATFTDVTAFRHGEEELRRGNETLEQRVAARTRELATATREAQRANAAKTRFLAAVSHDLAQPLNAAHLFTHALAQQLQHAEYAAPVANIDGALSSAEGLLGALLEVSRLDAGGLTPKIQAFPVGELLQPLVAEFSVLAREKGLRLRYVPTRAWVRSDAQLLRRLLQNFLANAVRYTSRGSLLLGCRRHGDKLSIEVWDTGPGIPEESRTLIFEEFRRLDRGGGGLGLGLSIAERIAQLLDHPLSLRSRLGCGSAFGVSLPRAAPESARRMDAAPAPTPAPRSRLLVVDNDLDVLRAMQSLLQGWGCEVLPARTPDEALELARREVPDMFLLDYHLDGAATGLELQAALIESIGERPCVLITADHSEAVRRAAARAQCHLLHKPLKPLALKSLVARLGRMGEAVVSSRNPTL
jgi:Na+/proline symporter/CheY-like chemotaxis protein